MTLHVLDLFSGIGGFSLGLERAGMQTVAFCEIDPYAQRVLKKHWPHVPIYPDITKLTYDQLRADGINRIDVLCGGFPCQDISIAGKRAGITGKRSGLWKEFTRLIGEIRPQFAILENVTNLLAGDGGSWFGRILGDLAEIGYDAQWHCIPASAIGAPHRRDRVWIIAYSESCRKSDEQKSINQASVGAVTEPICRIGKRNFTDRGAFGQRITSIMEKVITNSNSKRVERQRPEQQTTGTNQCFRSDGWDTESPICRMAHGLPHGVDRLRGLGNAIVPQISELIGSAILESIQTS